MVRGTVMMEMKELGLMQIQMAKYDNYYAPGNSLTPIVRVIKRLVCFDKLILLVAVLLLTGCF